MMLSYYSKIQQYIRYEKKCYRMRCKTNLSIASKYCQDSDEKIMYILDKLSRNTILEHSLSLYNILECSFICFTKKRYFAQL